jgi:hypothetical protein
MPVTSAFTIMTILVMQNNSVEDLDLQGEAKNKGQGKNYM